MFKKTDANQKQIVKGLREIGCSVLILSSVGHGCPDILVGYREKNYLFELKDGKKPPSQRELTFDEAEFFRTWRGQVQIINSLAQAETFIWGLPE